METININSQPITIGQFLKFAHIVSSGGDVKRFIITNTIYLDGVKVTQRGKKVYDNSIIKISNKQYLIKHNNGK